MAFCSDASSADRLQAAYKIMAWANQGSGVTQGNARDYAAALKVGLSFLCWTLRAPPTDGGLHNGVLCFQGSACILDFAWCHLPPAFCSRVPSQPWPTLYQVSMPDPAQVVFGVSHDPADFTTDRHNSDGQQVLLARFETIATDAQGGFPLFEILPLLLKPLA